MAIGMSELKKGLKIEVEGIPYKIVEYQHVKPGKGAAFVRAKIKSFLNGKTIEKTFHAGDKCETPNLQQKQMQFLYDDGELLQFMDNATSAQHTPGRTVFQTVCDMACDRTRYACRMRGIPRESFAPMKVHNS